MEIVWSIVGFTLIMGVLFGGSLLLYRNQSNRKRKEVMKVLSHAESHGTPDPRANPSNLKRATAYWIAFSEGKENIREYRLENVEHRIDWQLNVLGSHEDLLDSEVERRKSNNVDLGGIGDLLRTLDF